jgi:putative photosynthetic complex assembly protein
MSTTGQALRAVKLASPPPHGAAKTPVRDTFPRWVLMSAGGVIAFSLISVGLVRLTGNGPDQRPPVAAQERSLRFVDQADGTVGVIDGRTGEVVAQLQGEQGFVRGALRALSRERKANGVGAEAPFQLIAGTDGSLTLVDPVTKGQIALQTFGPTNAASFARFLNAAPATPSAQGSARLHAPRL